MEGRNTLLMGKTVSKGNQKEAAEWQSQVTLLPLYHPHGQPSLQPGLSYQDVADCCPFPSHTIFVLKFCNFVTDVGETSWKYNKQRGFGAVFSVYKVTLQIVTKISFCKQSEICKQSVLTGFYRKMTLYTNIFEPNFCNRSCQHLQSDWVTDI